ncbi:MAG: glycosyltransferase [Anaerolineaceae bacterium]|nr:glycosyltransferase [Anaerolineaceae bacterium]
MNILFLSRWFPFPATNGSKLRIYNLLCGLSAAHRVTLVSFYEPAEGAPDAAGLADLCQRVETVPWREYQPSSLRSLAALFNPTPRSVVDTFSPQMAKTIQTVLREGSFDLVIASQTDMAAYQPYFGPVPALLEEVETGIIYQEYIQSKGLSRLRSDLTWWKQRRYLRRLLPRFAACTVVSAQEAVLIRAAAPGVRQVEVIPNGFDLQAARQVQGDPQPDTLIYCGSFRYFANHEAMLWFVTEVFPLVRAQVPAAHLTITGDTAGRGFPVVEGVHLAGHVLDVRPLVVSSWLSLAPLRVGGGTRLKILESFALRTPVVATSKGAEGLAAHSGRHLLIADEPVDFAAQVVSLLRDLSLRQSLVEQAFRLVEEQYDWAVILPRFLALVESAGAERKP